jgi:hypothetical protein
MGAGQRAIEIGNDGDSVAERFERLEDRAELEAGARRRRRPVTGPLTHRHEHRAEAPHRRGRRPLRRGQRGNHGVEQR